MLLWTNARRKPLHSLTSSFISGSRKPAWLSLLINLAFYSSVCNLWIDFTQVIERNLIIWMTSPWGHSKADWLLTLAERFSSSSSSGYGHTVTSFVLSGSSLAVSHCFNHLSSADCGDKADAAEPLFHCPLLYLAFIQLRVSEFHVALEAECNLAHQMERFLSPFDFSDLSIW